MRAGKVQGCKKAFRLRWRRKVAIYGPVVCLSAVNACCNKSCTCNI